MSEQLDVDRLAKALRAIAFDMDLPPERITAHPRWYDEPGPDDHLVFDSDSWSKDVAKALAAEYEHPSGEDE